MTQNNTEPVRISKRMSELGMASRREADYWLEQGWVLVDGVPAVLGQKVEPHQKITLQRAAHTQQATQVTFLLHKPIGYVSGQAEDGYQNAAALITAGNRWAGCTAPQKFNFSQLKGLAPAGRLDIDSTGLLALTQDGRIAKLLIGEDSSIQKEYLVRVQYMRGREGERMPESALHKLRHGLELDGKPLKHADVDWQNEDQLRFVLREGKKRQIRRMCELVGLKVLGLKRVGIGSVLLRDLPMGQWRYLQAGERFDNELLKRKEVPKQFAGDVRFASQADAQDYRDVYGDLGENHRQDAAPSRSAAPRQIKRSPSQSPAPQFATPQGRPRERSRYDAVPVVEEHQRPGRPSTRTGDRKPTRSVIKPSTRTR
jgi:23S rRNA pseudouridine2604 synthase